MPQKKTFLGKVASGVLTRMSRGRLPQVEGSLTLRGLSAPVEILRDRWGIPHIYAQSGDDMFFAQGFVHAQDRLFQMELNRRTALGKLSELFGELALQTDRTVRTFGFNRLGSIDYENTNEEVRVILNAYAAGVNAYLDHPKSKKPIEMTLLNHNPEPWRPEDSAAFSRVMIWQLSHAWQSEIVRAEVTERVGEEHTVELDIQDLPENPFTLPAGIEFNALDPDGSLRQMPGPFLDRGKGSNAWAIGPGRSETGHAVLCNDMHLAISLPALWYEVHLNAPHFHASGVSIPGMPFVLVGHNEHIAWGMTLANTDAEDLFVEKFNEQDPPHYLFKEEWREAKIIEEPIKVKGIPDPFIEKVILTNHGPIISDVVGYPDQKVSVQSMALQPVPALEGFFRLNFARGWDDFVEAIRFIEAPQLSIMYADVEDNIGYWVSGRVPIRAKGDGSVPVPGWTGEYEWVAEIPFQEMPHGLNPKAGYIVNSNNKIVPDDYPHFLGNFWSNGYRAKRLETLIERHQLVSWQDHRDYQMDLYCIPGLVFVEKLNGIDDPDADVQLAIRLLSEWDGYLTPDSLGGSVYEVARYTMLRNILDPRLGQDLAVRLMGVGFHPLLAHSNEFFGHDTVTLLRLLDNPGSWWLQHSGGREALISSSLKQAVGWLRDNLGPDESDWMWGNIHQFTFEHALSLQKPFDQVFNRGPFPIGGDQDTPCQTAIKANEPYGNKAWSPSNRQIIDMGNLGHSLSICPPGQSANLASQHYDDLIQPWLEGEYHPMLWTREQVEGEQQSKLVLEPE